ncbi:hypothetical protein [Paracoccus shandongensis]|uniref:hypothetical protein n=1 Tax=Paracoccus shandongensis TaxID=2816048 RepID=UPI001A8FF147|nr:hypothetical protein [Paracoccus shandongensis]
MDASGVSGMITVLTTGSSTELAREDPDGDKTGDFRQHPADPKSADRRVSAK